MATRKAASSRSEHPAHGPHESAHRRPRPGGARRRGALYPRRRRSRPGLPTTVGTALGALVVTTLLDLSWPVRLGLVVVVLVGGLAYVVWRHRTEIAAGAATEGTPTARPDSPQDSTPPPVEN